MSDSEIRIKFGGDFSEMSKGASQAAQQAGTAFVGSIGKWAAGAGAAFAGAFAFKNIVDRAMDSVKNGLEYFHELHLALRRTGVDAAEFQKLSYAAKDANVSFDSLGRAMTTFNRNLGQDKQTPKFKETINKLFSPDEIKSGQVTAEEAIKRLADEYDKVGDSAKIAAMATNLFGLKGKEILPIITQGREALDSQTAGLSTFTDAEITGAAALEKRLLALKRKEAMAGKLVAAAAGKKTINEEFYGISGLAPLSPQEAARIGVTPQREEKEKMFQDKEQAKKVAEFYKKNYGLKPGEVASMLEQSTAGVFGTSMYKPLFDNLRGLQAEADKNKPKPVLADKSNQLALAASSLQAIGGGDINSVLSGVYNSDMLDTTRQIEINTRKPDPAHHQAPIGRAAR